MKSKPNPLICASNPQQIKENVTAKDNNITKLERDS